MGKLRKVFFELMAYDWRYVIAGTCVAIAAISFVAGMALAIEEENVAWLLLWLVSGASFGFLMGADV